MSVIDTIIQRAKTAPRHIVLPEGEDDRIVEASIRAVQSGIAQITLLGNEDVIRQKCRMAGAFDERVSIIDIGKLADQDNPVADLRIANEMVKRGEADGSLAGAVHNTGDVLRSALKIIGLAPKSKIVSSFFLMQVPIDQPLTKRNLIFADCAIRVDPNAVQLAEIAATAADNFRALQDQEPCIAFLSFATLNSASHASLEKIKKAVALLREQRPELSADGPLQFDAAFAPEVGLSKAPGSSVAGQANIYIFPDLNAGNIAYKVAERMGGAQAIGPILQGLAKPANDLSRGCDSDAVYNMIAVTVLQALSLEQLSKSHK